MQKHEFSSLDAESTGISGKDQRDEYISQVYLLYRGVLCDYIRARFGRDICEPEDVAQIAFIRLAEQCNSVQIKNPKAFLFTSARNIAIDEFRKARIRLTHQQDTLAMDDIKIMDDFSPENVFLEKEAVRLMYSAIEALPTVQRTVLLLHRLDNLSYTEISGRTGMPETTVRRLVARAVERLHQKLSRTD